MSSTDAPHRSHHRLSALPRHQVPSSMANCRVTVHQQSPQVAKNCRTTSTKRNPKTFLGFPKLPLELRTYIWRMTLSPRRIAMRAHARASSFQPIQYCPQSSSVTNLYALVQSSAVTGPLLSPIQHCHLIVLDG